MINIFICDDHNVVLEGLIAMLQNQTNIKVIGVAPNGQQCLRLLQNILPDIVLTDISMPQMDGIALCKQIKASHPQIKVLVLSTFNQGKIILNIMEAGADGYVLKNADKKEIIEAILTVHNGKKFIGYELDKLYNLAKKKQAQKPLITRREREVLTLIVAGLSNLDIATQLFISIDTVDSHRKNIHTKFGVKNLSSLLKYTFDNDILD